MYTARCARSGYENGVRRNGTSQTANGQNRNATHRLGVSNSAAGAAPSLRLDRRGDKPRRRQQFYEFAAQRREYYAVSRGGGEKFTIRRRSPESPRRDGIGTQNWTQNAQNTRTQNAGSATDP